MATDTTTILSQQAPLGLKNSLFKPRGGAVIGSALFILLIAFACPLISLSTEVVLPLQHTNYWINLFEPSSNAFHVWPHFLGTLDYSLRLAAISIGILIILNLRSTQEAPRLSLFSLLLLPLLVTWILHLSLRSQSRVTWDSLTAFVYSLAAIRLFLQQQRHSLRRQEEYASPPSIRNALWSLILLTGAGSWAALSCGAMSIPIVSCAWLACLPTMQRDATSQEGNSQTKRPSPALLLGVVLSLIFPLAISWCTPATTFPGYPEGARIVDDYGVPGFARPLVGQAPPTRTIDRVGVRRELRDVTIGTILPLLCAVFGSALARRAPPGAKPFFAMLFGLSVTLDLLAPEWIAQIAPLQAASRLVPGIAIMNLAPIAIALGVLILALNCAPTALFGSVLVIAVALNSYATRDHPLPFDMATHQGEIEAVLRSSHLSQEREIAGLPSEVVFSPSFGVFRRLGFSYPREIRDGGVSKLLPHRIRPSTLSASATAHETPLAFAADRDPQSRWSPGGGKQSQGTWLAINLPKIHRVGGVVLELGPFTSDFPRAFRVIPHCDQREALVFHPWRGPIRWTNDGYPYFGPQSDMTILFPSITETQCITIELVENAPAYDWSVSEVLLLEPAPIE